MDNQAFVINPLTGQNTTKAAFRIVEVAGHFSLIIDYLNFMKIRFDKNNLGKNTNIIYDLLKNWN